MTPESGSPFRSRGGEQTPEDAAFWRALDRHLAGEMGVDDVVTLAGWLAEGGGRAESLDALRTFLGEPIAYPPLAGGDELWARLSARMADEESARAHRAAAGGAMRPLSIRRRLARVLRVPPRMGTWGPLVGALAASVVMWTVVVTRAERLGRDMGRGDGAAAVGGVTGGAAVLPETAGAGAPAGQQALAPGGGVADRGGSDVGGGGRDGSVRGGVDRGAGADDVGADAGSSRLAAVGTAAQSPDVARSPYAGTPLDAGAGAPSSTSSALSVADEEPGAADSRWP